MSRRDDDDDDADETAATGETASLGHLESFVWFLELDALELSGKNGH